MLVRKAAAAGAKVSSYSICSPTGHSRLIIISISIDLTNYQALFLPEAADYIASSPAETISLARSVQDSEFVLGLQKEAQLANLHINVGIHEPASNGRIKNTLVWINEKGDITQRYQKVHLFDVDIKGGPVLKESA